MNLRSTTEKNQLGTPALVALALLAGCSVDARSTSPAPIAETREPSGDPSRGDGAPASSPNTGVEDAGTQPPSSPWKTVATAAAVKTALSFTTPARLYADPVTPARLLIGGAPPSVAGALAVVWSSGTFGPALRWDAPTSTLPFVWEGGGFDGQGRAYAYVCCVPTVDFPPNTQSMHKLAVASASGVWSWNAMPRPAGAMDPWEPETPAEWPPRLIALAPHAPARVVLSNGRLVWDIAAHPSNTDAWAASSVDRTSLPNGPSAIAFLGADKLLAVTQSAAGGSVRRCQMAGGALACAPGGATGLAPLDRPTELVVVPSDGSVYLVATNEATFARPLYRSTDGGASFTTVSLPVGLSFDAFAVSPTAAETIVLHETPTTSHPERLLVTKTGGTVWASLAPPSTTTTSFQGMAFDAAGSLYVMRGSTLFRAAPSS